jgi:hypothetical protein
MRQLPLLVLLGCAGNAPKGPDAANYCMGSAYDPCVDEHGCPLVTNAACQPVGSANFVVCTLPCTVGGTACPNDSTGHPGDCYAIPAGSSAGFCAPAVEPTCTARPPGL